MTEGLTPLQRRFVEKYLSVSVPGPGGPVDADAFRAAWRQARRSWQDASDTVDAQIARLQSVLIQSGDRDLEKIAEYGLNAITGNHRVPLVAAIMEIDRLTGLPSDTLIATTVKRIEAFEAHLASDSIVKAVDSNPFKVKMSVAALLTGALRELRGALRL